MEKEKRSPEITRLSWGEIEVAGAETFRDAKLFPGGAEAWCWDETGTRHCPGIRPADVRELLERRCTAVVLSTGMEGQLGVCPETVKVLEQSGVTVHVLPTKEAVRLYNELREKELPGGLFHTTC